MDFPSARFHRPVISSVAADTVSPVALAPSSATWPTANRAVLVPLVINAPYQVSRLWWANGAAVAGNVDCGVYTMNGTLLASAGSTAQAGTNVVQSVAVPLLLLPGSYYMALACSSTSATTFRSAVSVTFGAALGHASISAALPLPASATLTAMTSAYVPLFGIASASVI